MTNILNHPFTAHVNSCEINVLVVLLIVCYSDRSV